MCFFFFERQVSVGLKTKEGNISIEASGGGCVRSWRYPESVTEKVGDRVPGVFCHARVVHLGLSNKLLQ